MVHRKIFLRLPLIFLPKPCRNSSSLLFFSYLLDEPYEYPLSERYWGQLPNQLTAKGISFSFLYIYFENPSLPTSLHSFFRLRRLSKSTRSSHITLDSFLSPNLFFRILSKWFLCRSNPFFFAILVVFSLRSFQLPIMY